MANDKNKETKICEHCGRKLPVSEFALMHCRNYMNVCKECCAKKQKKTRNENDYKKAWNFILRMIPCISIENTRKSTETGH